MRYLLILVLFLVNIYAQDKQKVTIGAGVYTQTQPYKDVDNITLPSPVIFFDNEVIYIRWSRAGLYFYGDKQDDYGWGFSLTIQPRTFGYKASDSKYLYGLDEKQKTWEGGLAFSASMKDAHIEVMALTDILNRYDSWILKTEMGYDFDFKYFSLYPSLIIVYQSSEFLNYYYGISSEEAVTSNYQRYKASNGFQVGLQTYIKYPFTDSISALINLRADKLSNEATSSPIVHDDYIFSGLASLIYTFEY